MLFAYLKRILRLDRLRLRGLLGAQDEFLLAATAQNLRRMAQWSMPKAPKEAHALPVYGDKGRCARSFDRPLGRKLITVQTWLAWISRAASKNRVLQRNRPIADLGVGTAFDP